jgi:hypothetical protein
MKQSELSMTQVFSEHRDEFSSNITEILENLRGGAIDAASKLSRLFAQYSDSAWSELETLAIASSGPSEFADRVSQTLEI